MNAAHPLATSYNPEKLTEFFNNDISPETMAKLIRNLNYVITLALIRRNETLEFHNKELDQTVYWLNQLAENLDSYFSID
ncbi:hypothetical protein QWY99_03130 [Flavobacterium branchiarum]|uniref:Uncharacterized protein n=1 Tax=Flavobacterium branchiarum TaxID=1114870 RepID=A0ABV5FNC9_9FLAO|nr:hypothetical protein [Flavobacterium branchiarum]MDN3672061.1 hypothetical protein [Flavobacterium branchiarum]